MANPLRCITLRVAILVVLSMGWLFTMPSVGGAHEIRPAVADVTVLQTRIEMKIRLSGEPLVAGIDLEGLEDTNDAPEAAENDALRLLSDTAFVDRFREAWPRLQPGVIVDVDGTRIDLSLDEVEVIPEPDIELPRDMMIYLSADLPGGGAPARVGWVAAYGPIIVRQFAAGDDGYAGFLDGGALSDPLPRVAASSGSFFCTLLGYFGVGCLSGS